MRFAWFWLPGRTRVAYRLHHFVMTVIRVRTVGNADVVVWIIIGMLAFFLFRRTAVQVTHAVDSNRPLFTYRQVKPFDPLSLGRYSKVLMAIIALSSWALPRCLVIKLFLSTPCWLCKRFSTRWLFGIGYGLVASVLMALVPKWNMYSRS